MMYSVYSVKLKPRYLMYSVKLKPSYLYLMYSVTTLSNVCTAAWQAFTTGVRRYQRGYAMGLSATSAATLCNICG